MEAIKGHHASNTGKRKLHITPMCLFRGDKEENARTGTRDT